MGLLDRGAASLSRLQKSAGGRTITYSRGAESTTLIAWLGNTLFAQLTEEPGASVVWGERDYLFEADDLIIDGATVLPQRGDRITETIGSEEFVFELVTPTGEPVWRYSDHTRTILRVHTKRVK